MAARHWAGRAGGLWRARRLNSRCRHWRIGWLRRAGWLACGGWHWRIGWLACGSWHWRSAWRRQRSLRWLWHARRLNSRCRHWRIGWLRRLGSRRRQGCSAWRWQRSMRWLWNICWRHGRRWQWRVGRLRYARRRDCRSAGCRSSCWFKRGTHGRLQRAGWLGNSSGIGNNTRGSERVSGSRGGCQLWSRRRRHCRTRTIHRRLRPGRRLIRLDTHRYSS